MTPTQHIDLSFNWTFVREKVDINWLNKDDIIGNTVDLPHSWNETDTYQKNVTYYQGDGAYRKSFILPKDHSLQKEPYCWNLVAEGFYGAGDVWINGTHLDQVEGQYLGFQLDVTDRVLAGERNFIGIRLNNNYHPYILPGKKDPDFLLYGGMAGRVYLQRVPALSIEPYSLRVICADPLNTSPNLHVMFSVRNLHNEPRKASPRCHITNNEGILIYDCKQSPSIFNTGLNHFVTFSCRLKDPSLWDLYIQNLYTVTCSLHDGTRQFDKTSTRTGIREAKFVPNKGFTLNGNRIQLIGANRHESMPGFGNALPAFIHDLDAKLFKDIGLNFVRLSHYPQSSAFLDACDRIGILVYPEIATWKSIRPGPWQRAACKQMSAMILRDRNHPSIVLWGMGNESRSKLVFSSLRRIVKKNDLGRPTIYAENHLHRGKRRRTLKSADVLGINYELNKLDDAHHLSRNKVLLISEMSNNPFTFRGDTNAEIDQVMDIEKDLAIFESKQFVSGSCLWSFNDYATNRKNRFFRHCGVIDAWRIPKLSAAYIKARFSKDPYISLHANWSSINKTMLRKINIFTNCKEVILYIDDQSVSTLQGKWHMQTEVKFEPKILSAQGRLGNIRVKDSIVPWGSAHNIKLTPIHKKYIAIHRNTTLIKCIIEDAEGNKTADWQGHINIQSNGPAKIRLHSLDPLIPIAEGIGHIFITGTGQPGLTRISAMHTELKPGYCSIQFF